jgi:hypothetical protein
MVLYLPKFCNRTSLYVPAASGASVDPTSQVCSSAILALPIAEDCKIWFCVSPQWHNFHTKLHLNSSRSSSVESCRRTDRHDQPYMHSYHGRTLKKARGLAKLIVSSVLIGAASFKHSECVLQDRHVENFVYCVTDCKFPCHLECTRSCPPYLDVYSIQNLRKHHNGEKGPT